MYAENTGIATPEALIAAICSFVNSGGWTIERNNLVGSNRTATVRLPGTTDYIHLFNDTSNEVKMRTSVGYNGATTPTAQPDVQPYATLTNGLAGPFPIVYFFMEDDEVHVVIATASSEEYRHICFGIPEKIGTYTGGTYAAGTYRTSNYLGDFDVFRHSAPFTGETNGGGIRVDVAADSRVNFFHRFHKNDAVTTYGRANTGISSYAQRSLSGGQWLGKLVGGADRNIFSGRSIFHPIHIFIDRTGSPTYASPVATIRNTRVCNLAKLAVAQEVTIGSDTWKVFPIFKRSLIADNGSAAPDYGSHTLGYAIKKVP